MEKTAGSIAIGKVADFVILSENPLSCTTDISSMQILATIKEDELVYGEYPKWRNGHFIRLEEQ